MPTDDEIGAAYARWHRANDRYKELDAQTAGLEDEISRAEEEMWAIFEARPRTEREQLDEDITRALAPLHKIHDDTVEAAAQEYFAKVEDAEQTLEREIDRVMATFADRESVYDDDDDEPHWTSPQFEAAKTLVEKLRTSLAEVKRLRVDARHELDSARDAKRRASGRG
jgi:chromosome segregation ATPase